MFKNNLFDYCNRSHVILLILLILNYNKIRTKSKAKLINLIELPVN